MGATARVDRSQQRLRSESRRGVRRPPETEEIPGKSEACVAAAMAPIEKVVYVRQDDLTAALIAGRSMPCRPIRR